MTVWTLTAVVLFIGEPGRFEEERIRHANLSDIVKVSAQVQRAQVGDRQPELLAESSGVSGETLTMPVGVGITGLDGQRQTQDHRFSRFELVSLTFETEKRPHARFEFLAVEWLAQKLVGASIDPANAALAIPEPCQEDHRREARGGVPFDGPADVETVQPGQLHVENDEVGRLLLNDRKSGFTVGSSANLVAERRQKAFDQPAIRRLIVNDQHQTRRSARLDHGLLEGAVVCRICSIRPDEGFHTRRVNPQFWYRLTRSCGLH